MSLPNETTGSTSAQLRHDINSGRSGEKTPGVDPAMSPLGTDDEAGGNPLSPEEISFQRRQEVGRAPSVDQPNGSQPDITPDGRQGGWNMTPPILLAAAAAIALGALLVVAL